MTMKATLTDGLSNASDLARDFGIDPHTARIWLEKAGVKPEVIFPSANGWSRWWKPALAHPVIQDKLDARKPSPVEELPFDVTPASTYTPTCLDVVEENIANLTDQIAALKVQNQQLFRSFTKVVDDMNAKMDKMMEACGVST